MSSSAYFANPIHVDLGLLGEAVAQQRVLVLLRKEAALLGLIVNGPRAQALGSVAVADLG